MSYKNKTSITAIDSITAIYQAIVEMAKQNMPITCRYHGRVFCAKITHCFINTQMDEISLYIVYVNYLGSLSSPIF